ncbi:MAG: class I SAM-dependent methyltransferase [Deltaproteobacteria bacterium]|nr:class I SAM-dependent methyltransferase [Deltaproteobacteria bacterium]
MSESEQAGGQLLVTKDCAAALELMQAELSKALNELAQESSGRNLQAGPERIQHFPSRLDLAFWYVRPTIKRIFHWLFQSEERSNFTYSITDENKDYLAAFCAVITGQASHKMRDYIDELCRDSELREHVLRQRSVLAQQHIPIDPHFDFGRRLGWYTLVRALKPKIVIETGVAQGLGSLVLTSALMRNAQEGHPGYYFGTELDRNAGFLFSGKYAEFGKIFYGDSIESLKKLDAVIDLFINDSDHSAQYEQQEYEVISSKLSKRAVVLADNAHVTSKLCDFARSTGREFLYFQERPKDHWYPGAGIGAAFTKL